MLPVHAVTLHNNFSFLAVFSPLKWIIWRRWSGRSLHVKHSLIRWPLGVCAWSGPGPLGSSLPGTDWHHWSNEGWGQNRPPRASWGSLWWGQTDVAILSSSLPLAWECRGKPLGAKPRRGESCGASRSTNLVIGLIRDMFLNLWRKQLGSWLLLLSESPQTRDVKKFREFNSLIEV